MCNLTYKNYFYLCHIYYVTTAHLLFTNKTAINIIIILIKNNELFYLIYICIFNYILVLLVLIKNLK